MKEYIVIIRETLEKAFNIMADSEEEAMEIAQYHYDRGEYDFVLSSDNLTSTDCFCQSEK